MKKTILILSLLVYAIPSYAQNVTELNLKITPDEVNIIWKALRKLPVEEVEALMNKIRLQATEQTTPKPENKDKPEVKEPGKK